MEKRGQIEISFGMIFSIIIIIALVGVAIYAIMHFLSLKNCTDAGLFYQDVQGRITNSWNAVEANSSFSESVPNGVTSVCFGSSGMSPAAGSETQYNLIMRYYNEGNNVMLYPPQGICSGMEVHTFEHIKTNNFFCVNAVNGKVVVKLSKASSDSLVTVSG